MVTAPTGSVPLDVGSRIHKSAGLLDRVRELGRRLGDALDDLARGGAPRPQPIPVPVRKPVVRRRSGS